MSAARWFPFSFDDCLWLSKNKIDYRDQAFIEELRKR